MKTCKIETCDTKHVAGGFCEKHYRANKDSPECWVSDCQRPQRAKQLCDAHYRRQLKYGDVNVILSNQGRPVLERFWNKVSIRGNHWIWVGAVSSSGYGSFEAMLAHKWAYEYFVRPVPSGLELDHLCANASETKEDAFYFRRCVNPQCLEPVSHQINCQRGKLSTSLLLAP